MFSNHTGAIPLGEDERRFWIVSHQGKPHAPEYYTALYAQLGDPLFIAPVAEFLKRRDVSGFKPGERPPMNAGKAELVAFSQTEHDLTLREIVARWPVDLITALELAWKYADSAAGSYPLYPRPKQSVRSRPYMRLLAREADSPHGGAEIGSRESRIGRQLSPL